MADLTISIVSHGHGPFVEALLADLSALPPPQPRVILTFNIAEDMSFLERFAHLDPTVLINETPKGFAENHNTAFGLCRSEWFCVLNPDVRLPAPPFERLIAAAGPEVALVAPRVVASDGANEDSVRVNLTPWALIARHTGGAERPQKRAFRWLAGMFLLIRSDAFAAVGGFDTRFFLYCEDYDLSARLVLAGYRLMLVPDVAVVHQARRASRRSLRHLRWHLTGLAKVWTSRAFLSLTWRTWRDPAAFALARQNDVTAAAADKA